MQASYMIHELDVVVLTHDLEAYTLKRGDVGAIVHAYKDGSVYEVEFVTAEGRTLALLTLTQADIRPVGGKEIFHVRELAQAA